MYQRFHFLFFLIIILFCYINFDEKYSSKGWAVQMKLREAKILSNSDTSWSN